MGRTRGICSYCETVVERPAGLGDGEPIVVARSTALGAHPRPRPQRGCAAFLVFLALFGAGLIAAAALMFPNLMGNVTSRATQALKTGRISDIVDIVPRDADQDDLLVLLRHDDSSITLGMRAASDGSLRWETTPLSKEMRKDTIVRGPETIYLVDQTKLQAFRLSDGTALWQASLNVEPQLCDDCMQIADDRLIVLEKDRTIQTFDIHSGQLAWSRRLDDAPGHLPIIGDQIAIATTNAGDAELQLVNIASGTIVEHLKPGCKQETPSYRDASFSRYSPVLISADQKALFTFSGSYASCVQRWERDSDTATWTTWLDSDIAPSSWDAHTLLQTAQAFFIAHDGILTALDTKSGTLTPLTHDPDYSFTPLFARDNTVVVKAAPTWDSRKHSLWAFDTSTGARRWQYTIRAKEWFGDSGFNEWGTQLTPQGVAIVQVPRDEHQISIERLNLTTGASLGSTSATLDDSGSTVVWDNRWNNRMAWLLVNNTLATIDLVSGTIATQER